MTGDKLIVDSDALYWLMLHVGCPLKYLSACESTENLEAQCTMKNPFAGCHADPMFECWKRCLKAEDIKDIHPPETEILDNAVLKLKNVKNLSGVIDWEKELDSAIGDISRVSRHFEVTQGSFSHLNRTLNKVNIELMQKCSDLRKSIAIYCREEQTEIDFEDDDEAVAWFKDQHDE